MIGRLQSLDLTSGLDWWTGTKNHFMASNKTHYGCMMYYVNPQKMQPFISFMHRVI